MAVQIKKKSAADSKSTTSTMDMLATYQKDYGENVGSVGGKLINSERIPTGMFPLDLCLNGGLPRGKVTSIYGPESSSKTNLALMAVASHQRLWPEKLCVFFDIEQSFDPAWAAALGVDTKRLVVIKPSYAEQMIDMCEGLLHTDDCGVVVIDSLAALMTTSEKEASAEANRPGGAGSAVGKLCRRTTLALGEAEKAGNYPTLIYINQMRYKIGIVYGNPETQPGGDWPKYQSAIRLRVHGKNIIDPKVSKVMPVRKEVQFVVQKWKVPILAASGRFEMVTHPHDGLPVGFCDDYSVIQEYLEALGAWAKHDKKGWVICGETYATQAEFKAKLYGDPKFGATVRKSIIESLAQSNQVLAEGGGG